MYKKIGIACIAAGFISLLAAAGIIIYNSFEEQHAKDASYIMLQNVQQKIADNAVINEEAETESTETNEDVVDTADNQLETVNDVIDTAEDAAENESVSGEFGDNTSKMQTMKIDRYDCIGILSIPVLELELPILTDWSYAKLKIAPCHYYGSCHEGNFVIAGHNYRSHFANLHTLKPKDLIMFTDVTGALHIYEVVLIETLPANATQEMISSGFDLSLYTCTKTSTGRTTVRCNMISRK